MIKIKILRVTYAIYRLKRREWWYPLGFAVQNKFYHCLGGWKHLISRSHISFDAMQNTYFSPLGCRTFSLIDCKFGGGFQQLDLSVLLLYSHNKLCLWWFMYFFCYYAPRANTSEQKNTVLLGSLVSLALIHAVLHVRCLFDVDIHQLNQCWPSS